LIAAHRAKAVTPSTPQRNPVIKHDRSQYKARKHVERFFNKIKRSRAVATRRNKRDDDSPASVQPASIRS